MMVIAAETSAGEISIVEVCWLNLAYVGTERIISLNCYKRFGEIWIAGFTECLVPDTKSLQPH